MPCLPKAATPIWTMWKLPARWSTWPTSLERSSRNLKSPHLLLLRRQLRQRPPLQPKRNKQESAGAETAPNMRKPRIAGLSHDATHSSSSLINRTLSAAAAPRQKSLRDDSLHDWLRSYSPPAAHANLVRQYGNARGKYLAWSDSHACALRAPSTRDC